jgi:hypothetical protein
MWEDTLQALERENLSLHTQLKKMKGDAEGASGGTGGGHKAGGKTDTNVIIRGLQHRLLVLADDKARIQVRACACV